MAKFGTIEWWQEFKKLADKDPLLPKMFKNFSTTITYKITDKPEVKPVVETITNGKVEIRYAQPDEVTEFGYEAPLAVWKDVMAGKYVPTKEILILNQHGPIRKYQDYLNGMVKNSEIQKKVSTEW
jgi:hypothetical protein